MNDSDATVNYTADKQLSADYRVNQTELDPDRFEKRKLSKKPLKSKNTIDNQQDSTPEPGVSGNAVINNQEIDDPPAERRNPFSFITYNANGTPEYQKRGFKGSKIDTEI